jgi:hypothetical protein
MRFLSVLLLLLAAACGGDTPAVKLNVGQAAPAFEARSVSMAARPGLPPGPASRW